MGKVIRNTVFTITAIGLTAFSVGWNKQVVKIESPAAITQAVLTSPVSTNTRNDFPLDVSVKRDYVKLGQYQEITVKTEPFADLEIVTVYPTGTINNPQTIQVKASETGTYVQSYKLNDFHYLGIFQVIVRAKLGERETEKSGRFVLQTWIQSSDVLNSEGYIYPIVP